MSTATLPLRHQCSAAAGFSFAWIIKALIRVEDGSFSQEYTVINYLATVIIMSSLKNRVDF